MVVSKASYSSSSSGDFLFLQHLITATAKNKQTSTCSCKGQYPYNDGNDSQSTKPSFIHTLSFAVKFLVLITAQTLLFVSCKIESVGAEFTRGTITLSAALILGFTDRAALVSIVIGIICTHAGLVVLVKLEVAVRVTCQALGIVAS